MRIPDFELERFFARWEFAARHLLCASDMEPVPMRELLARADGDTRALWDDLVLGYTETSGHPELRAAIAELHPGCDAEDVLTFSGAQEGIFLAMHGLLERDDHVVVVVPAYQSLHEVARSIGAAVTLLPLRHEEGWRLSLDAVRRALTPRTRLVVVNFPHNPTGSTLSQPELRELAALCEEAGARLFSDEVYRHLVPADPPLPAAAELSERALSLGVVSKAWGLAGLRVGWIVCRDGDARARIARLRDYTTICGSAPSEILALMALRARGPLLARARAIVAGNTRLAEGLVARNPERLEWVAPRAGSVAFPRLRQDDADAFAARLVERHGVLLLPGSRFGVPGGHFRLGLGRRGMEEGLGLLEAALRG